MSLPDEISRIMAEAMAEQAGRAATPDDDWPNGLPAKWIAYVPLVEAARERLLAAGYEIVPSTNSLLKKGEGVVLNE